MTWFGCWLYFQVMALQLQTGSNRPIAILSWRFLLALTIPRFPTSILRALWNNKMFYLRGYSSFYFLRNRVAALYGRSCHLPFWFTHVYYTCRLGLYRLQTRCHPFVLCPQVPVRKVTFRNHFFSPHFTMWSLRVTIVLNRKGLSFDYHHDVWHARHTEKKAFQLSL